MGLTDQGFALIDGMMEPYVAAQAQAVSGRDGDEGKQLSALLAKLIAAHEFKAQAVT